MEPKEKNQDNQNSNSSANTPLTNKTGQDAKMGADADAILAATDKARNDDAWFELTDEDRAAIDRAQNELLVVYHSDDHLLIREHVEKLNQATVKLAENMMNTAVSRALKAASSA